MRGKVAYAGLISALLVMTGIAAAPARAQFSESYNFLKAVRDRDGEKATQFAEKPGSTIINTKDYSTGDGALHIVVQRRDSQWLSFLLFKGADPDIHDRNGNTPLAVAAQLGWVDGARLLLEQRANVNAVNDRGETPLILAVQRRDLPTVRLLLDNGANPALSDHIAGMSARDYAERDTRTPALLKAIQDAKPAKPAAQVAGPKLKF